MVVWQTGGMPQMVFEYVLKQQGIDPKKDLTIDKSIDFGSTAAAFPVEMAIFPLNLNRVQPI